MKKIIALFLGIFMVMSSFAASAKVPEFLKETYNNCTADYVSRVEFKSGDDINALLNEAQIPEEISNHVDIGGLLEGILSSESKIRLELDVSEDYKKIDFALTEEGSQKVALNANFNADVNYKSGLWVHMDFAKDEPEFYVVYTSPLHNKYGTVDVMSYLTEEEIDGFSEIFESILSSGLIENVNNASVNALDKYASVKQRGNKYTLHMDNAAFVKMMDEVLNVTVDEVFKTIENLPEKYALEVTEEMKSEAEFPVFDRIEILGKDGIRWEYELNPQGKIKSGALFADVEMSIAKIYSQITGEEWMYDSQGIIDLDISMQFGITHLGKTVPSFPVLTEENSFESEFFAEMLGREEDYDYEYLPEDYFDEYPSEYVFYTMDKEVSKDGNVYFPLEEILNEAYGEACVCENNEGNVNINCSYFANGDTVTLKVGDDVAHMESGDVKTGEVLEIDGVVYVSEKFFDALGWTMESYTTNLLSGEVSAEFFTGVFSYVDYEQSYPAEFIWGSYEGLLAVDGVNYVPLRKTFEEAYGDKVSIDYADGVVTVSSDKFDGFDTFTVKVGDTFAYADGVQYPTPQVKVMNSSVFVDIDLFQKVFGWEISYIEYSKTDNSVYYGITTTDFE